MEKSRVDIYRIKIQDLIILGGYKLYTLYLNFTIWGAIFRGSTIQGGNGLGMIDSGRGTTRAEDAQGTPTQSHISPSIRVYEEESFRMKTFWGYTFRGKLSRGYQKRSMVRK